MQLKRVKSSKELVLAGVNIDSEFRDGLLHSVTLIDANGTLLKFSMDSYSMYAYVVEPPKREKKFVLVGSVAGIADINEQFDSEWDAKQRKQGIEDKVRDEVSLNITEQEVDIPF